MTKQQLVNEIKEIHTAIRKVKVWMIEIASVKQNGQEVSEAIMIGCKEVSKIINWKSKQTSSTKQQLIDARDAGLAYLTEINAKMDKALEAM